MAQPACRRAINRRVTGDPNEWPLDWFRRIYGQTPFERGISWGCGMGGFERSAIRIQLARAIDAYDISDQSLEQARRETANEGLEGIRFALGDFDDPRIARDRYDIAFFHASLHHVTHLGRLFRRMSLCLRRRALVYVDEYVGPSRTQWTQDRLLLAQSLLDLAPAQAKLRDRIDPPVEMEDPSEAVRSSEIRPFLRMFLDIEQWRPYGGQVTGLVVPHVDAAWLQTPPGCRYLEALLGIEEYEIERAPETSNHLVAVGRLKPWPRNITSIARQAALEFRRRRARSSAQGNADA